MFFELESFIVCFFGSVRLLTNRERHKSAPYPRHKNSKRTSKFRVFSFTVLKHRKTKRNGPSGAPGPASASPWRAKRMTLSKLSTFLLQLTGGPFGEKNFRKKSHNAKKLKGGTLLRFFNIHSVVKYHRN